MQERLAQLWYRVPGQQRIVALIGIVLLAFVVFTTTSSLLAVRPGVVNAAARPTATPLPRAGFTYYTDDTDGFQLQFPAHWEQIDQNPGVEFDDNAQNPVYILQVLLPTNQGTNPDWVAAELDKLQQTTNVTDIVRAPGIVQAHFGNVVWSGGAALLKEGDSTIAVQVLATTYDGRTYVVNELVANGDIADAENRYFDAMLNSFAFLS